MGKTLVPALALLAACAGPGAHAVDIRDLAFAPGEVVVRVGDTVTWTNHDIVPHAVTFRDTDTNDHVAVGGTFDLVVPAGDTLHYWCRYHPSMTGRLVVE